jgi:hypothetical protein
LLFFKNYDFRVLSFEIFYQINFTATPSDSPLPTTPSDMFILGDLISGFYRSGLPTTPSDMLILDILISDHFIISGI